MMLSLNTCLAVIRRRDPLREATEPSSSTMPVNTC